MFEVVFSVYQSKGISIIVNDTWQSAYLMRRYGKKNSSLRKFMTQVLYLLLPTILPCEHLDTPDMRYLNSDFAPKNHSFANTLDIESYNTHWYDDKPPSRVPTFIRDSHVLSVSAIAARPLSKNMSGLK